MLHRRRFIMISASAAALPFASFAATPVAAWRGAALGAEASLRLVGLDDARAAPLIAAARDEMARMEAIFSLHRPDSALSRLNGEGALAAPPQDLTVALGLCGALHRATQGAFDPTIQPLWRLLAESRGRPDPEALAEARALIGWDGVRVAPDRIAFARPGMALTLNGVAQGFATDRVADILRAAGLRDVLVSVGEISASGLRADGRPWRVGVAEAGDGPVEEVLELTDMAAATSAPAGTLIDPETGLGHIIDPRTGAGAARWRRVTVLHRSAAVADGLSTGIACMARDAVPAALAAFAGARAIAVGADGARLETSA